MSVSGFPRLLKIFVYFCKRKILLGNFNLQIYNFKGEYECFGYHSFDIFIPAVIQGIRNGFIAQIISIAALILGVWASARFTPEVSSWLAQYITVSEQVMKVISFAAILITSFLILAVAGKFLEATFKLVMLGWLNRLLRPYSLWSRPASS